MSVDRVDAPYTLLFNYLAGLDYGGSLLVIDAGYGPLLPLATRGFSPTFLERNLRAFRLLHRNAQCNGIAQPDIRLSDAFTAVGSGELFEKIVFVYHPHDGTAYIREIMALSARHLAENGCLLLCGRTRKGVAGYERYMSTLFTVAKRIFSRKGIRLIEGRMPVNRLPGVMEADTIEVWKTRAGTSEIQIQGVSGLFSHDSLDQGTSLLLEAMADHLPKGKCRILDLGCGTGIIGIAAALINNTAEVDLTDVDLRAARCALKNCDLNGVERSRIFLGDGVLNLPEGEKYDLILSHPQLHTGGDVIETFIREPVRRLRPRGRLLLVAARGSKILDAMNRYVGPAAELVHAPPYSVLLASRR